MDNIPRRDFLLSLLIGVAGVFVFLNLSAIARFAVEHWPIK